MKDFIDLKAQAVKARRFAKAIGNAEAKAALEKYARDCESRIPGHLGWTPTAAIH